MSEERGPRLSKRREYLDDYKKDESGKYVYTGLLYTYADENGRSRKTVYALMWLFTVVLLAALVGGGLFKVPGMVDCPYVLIPYAGAVIAALTMLWGMTSLSMAGHPLTKHDYETTVPKIPRRAYTAAVCSAITILGEIVFLIINGSGGIPALNTVFYFVLIAAAGGSAFASAKLFSAASWKESK